MDKYNIVKESEVLALHRFDETYSWMMEAKNGEYVLISDVLELIYSQKE